MSAKGGRKTREAKLEALKALKVQKEALREKLNEEIKEISTQITEIEQYFLLQKVNKLKETLEKKGLTIDEVAKAIENGELSLTTHEKEKVNE